MSRNGRSVVKLGVLVTAALLVCLVVGVAPAAGADGSVYVDKNTTRDCAGLNECYLTIQEGVENAGPGDTVYVFPGTYKEGVDLKKMDDEGDITLITVDASGNPTPGTVTVNNPDDDSEIYTGDPLTWFDGDVTIDGFVLRSEYGAIELWVGPGDGAAEGGTELGPALGWNVEIRNVDASHTGGDGIRVDAYGNVTITDCTTNGNNGAGILVYDTWGYVTITGCTSNENTCLPGLSGGGVACIPNGIAVDGAGGKITISDCTANGNGWAGIYIFAGLIGSQEGSLSVTMGDQVMIDRCTADQNNGRGIEVRGAGGDVRITDCTTDSNSEDGVLVRGLLYAEELGAGFPIDGGDVTIQNCTANGNDEVGFDPTGILGTLSIQACVAQDNYIGVDLDAMGEAESVLVNGSIICGNECGLRYAVPQLNAEGNWWGCAGGPEAAGCDPICQEDSIEVDFMPWIKTISASATVDPVTAGQPTVVSFQFSGGPPAVYLGQGPGDLHGDPTFIVSTDNGTVMDPGFINEPHGVLAATLIPASGGTATVTMDGPCGLDEGVVLDVLAAGAEFVPEPGSVLLLGSGLMGLAGYAVLRLRKR